MSGEEGLGPHNEERLCPVPDGSCKYDEKQPIEPGTCGALYLTAKDDQLLSQQGVLGSELGLGASEIGERPCLKGLTPRARPTHYTALDPTE